MTVCGLPAAREVEPEMGARISQALRPTIAIAHGCSWQSSIGRRQTRAWVITQLSPSRLACLVVHHSVLVAQPRSWGQPRPHAPGGAPGAPSERWAPAAEPSLGMQPPGRGAGLAPIRPPGGGGGGGPLAPIGGSAASGAGGGGPLAPIGGRLPSAGRLPTLPKPADGGGRFRPTSR